MNVPAEIFREYDIRGLVDTHLTPQFAEHLGKAVGTHVLRGGGKSLVVGRDCRASGSSLAEALMAGWRPGVPSSRVGRSTLKVHPTFSFMESLPSAMP